MHPKLLAAMVVGSMYQNEASAEEHHHHGGHAATTAEAAPAAVARPLTIMTEVSYFFKKDKLGVKRDTVKLNIPFVTIDGLVEALSDEKQQAYLLSIINDSIYQAGKWQVGDENKPVNKQEELDLSKLTLEALANMPPSERRGGGIAKEVWEEFGKDYAAVMQPLTGKTTDQIDNAVALLLKKFQPVKSNKRVLAHLKSQLNMWFAATQAAEDFKECFEFLDAKAQTFLDADEAALLVNL